jgi:hypothetical protein
MSARNTPKVLEIRRTKEELLDYLSRFDLELRLESPVRHLEPIGRLCTLLLDRLVLLTGGTLETNAFGRLLQSLLARAHALHARPTAPITLPHQEAAND